MEVVNNIVNWQFMNEPLTKWFIFFGALLAISVAWKGILGFID